VAHAWCPLVADEASAPWQLAHVAGAIFGACSLVWQIVQAAWPVPAVVCTFFE
jgi:hypothetical protein